VPPALDVSLVHTLPHDSVVCSVHFSADGKYLATGSNRAAHIYDVLSGEQLCALRHDPSEGDGHLYVRAVRFSPDGKYLATGAEDKLVRVGVVLHPLTRAPLMSPTATSQFPQQDAS
jgi:glucose repression regulatory protein TUP1